jgi:hypothetical protein
LSGNKIEMVLSVYPKYSNKQTTNEMEINNNNNNNNNIELAEGWFEEDKPALYNAMRNRGVPQEAQERIMERIVERWDATDRHEEIENWLVEEGIARTQAENIIVDWMLQHAQMRMTLEYIQEEFGIGFHYIPIPVQQQARG